MSEAGERGPQVSPHETLYRAIVSPEWLDLTVDPPRVRSFAFRVDLPFSVNIASLMDLQGAVDHMSDVLHCPEGAIVSFNCGEARSERFDARHEPDPERPTNKAHANVYYDGTKSSRKKAAKRLAEKCMTEHMPSFRNTG